MDGIRLTTEARRLLIRIGATVEQAVLERASRAISEDEYSSEMIAAALTDICRDFSPLQDQLLNVACGPDSESHAA